MGKGANYLTDSEIRALEPRERGYARSVYRNLRIWVEPESKGGGKSFEHCYRFPPKKYMQYYRIGVYGKGQGQLSLKQAIEAQRQLFTWMDSNPNKNPKERKRELKIEKLSNTELPTFELLIDDFLKNCGNRESTIKDNRRKFNQVLNYIPANTKLKNLQYDSNFEGKSGRQRVMEVIEHWEKANRQSHAKKLLSVMRTAFDYAIEKKGWMPRGSNPATSSRFVAVKYKEESHPAITDWKKLPALFDCFEKNPANADEVVINALKCCFLTGLRVGSLVAMRWDYIDDKNDWIHMPAEIMKGDVDFDIPITAPLKSVLERMSNYPSEYVFWSFRGRKTEYLNPSALNQSLKRMGYGGIHTAHGTRSTIQTCGQEILGFERELIQRCLAHKVGTKLSRRYDKAQFFEDRKKFLTAWGEALLENGLKV